MLPDKLSELMLVALADLKACENDPAYEIHMSDWHCPINRVCEVCFAGAVMAKTLGVSSLRSSAPNSFGHGNKSKLLAINAVRVGRVQDALISMGMYIDNSYAYRLDRDVVDYHHNPEWFVKQMNYIVTDLEEAGL